MRNERNRLCQRLHLADNTETIMMMVPHPRMARQNITAKMLTFYILLLIPIIKPHTTQLFWCKN